MTTDNVSAERAKCEWVHIAAVAENGVIGSDGGIPWDLPEDMERFKAETMGHPVVQRLKLRFIGGEHTNCTL
mgnify:CR=1 FL=1